MFEVGDRIVYPMYGAGTVEAIEENNDGEIKEKHYIIKIPNGSLKIKVSAKKTETIGIRLVSDEVEINSAIEMVAKRPVVIQSNWNQRYKENLEKIKTGKLCEVIEVTRALMLREKERGLSSAEKKMLNNAKQIVVSEIAYAKKIEQEVAEEYLAKKLLS